MSATQVSLSKFEAECLKILRQVSEHGTPIEVTDQGKVVAVITPPQAQPSMRDFAGSLKGTVAYEADWDAPLGAEAWKTSK